MQTVGRTATGITHPKLREVLHANLLDLSAIEEQLAGFDACFFCLGVSSVGMDEAAYTAINYDMPVAVAVAAQPGRHLHLRVWRGHRQPPQHHVGAG